jgi:type VI protein secretion system component VasF
MSDATGHARDHRGAEGRDERFLGAEDEARLLHEAKQRALALAHKEAAAEARALARRRRIRWWLVTLGAVAVVVTLALVAALAWTSGLAGRLS